MHIVNREDFIRLVQHPRSISAPDLESLEELAKVFPYCQLAHFLIAKAHVERATMLAPQKLQKAAVYATHRDILRKHLIDILEKENEPAAQPNHADSTLHRSKAPELIIESPIHDSLVYSIAHRKPDGAQDSSATKPGNPVVQEEADHSIRIRQSRQQEIIENFIKTEPRISSLNQQIKEVQTERDLSERSIKQPTGLASENLANIMIRQGKYGKAIEIYETLMLKNPEKKAYFADKIKELKNR